MFAVTPDWVGCAGRIRLLQAGWALLCEVDPAQLQIKTLVEVAGVSRALFHKNFGSVSALLSDLAGAGLATLIVNVKEEETFEAFAGAWIRFADARPRHYALMWSPQYAEHTKIADRINELCRQLSVLAQARLGRKPSQPQVQVLLGIIHGAASVVGVGFARQSNAAVAEPLEAYLSKL